MADFWKNRSVFLTGGGGFVGGWLAKALVDRGARVVCILRDDVADCVLRLQGTYDRVTRVHGDICDYATVERVMNEYEVEAVFHLAAQALVSIANRSPLSTFEANIRGTWNVLEAARTVETVKRTVVASSDKAYGSHETLPYKEDFAMQGLHPYDASKSCTDILARTYAHTWGMPVTVTRCGNIYGGGDLNWNRIVPETIQLLLEGKAPSIRSDGTFLRDYLYVEDAADAYMTLAEHTHRDDIKGRAFNFGLGRPVSVLEIVNQLIAIHGVDVAPTIHNHAAGEIKDQYLDSSLAERVFGWKPTHELEAGLRKSYDWYKNFLSE